MKIILDAMGGDNAPMAPVMGAVQAAKDFGAQIILVGRGEEILGALKQQGIETLPAGLEIVHAEGVVDNHEDPTAAVRKQKDSSMMVSLKMLADGEGDAVISAGSTGALLTGATLFERVVTPTFVTNETLPCFAKASINAALPATPDNEPFII